MNKTEIIERILKVLKIDVYYDTHRNAIKVYIPKEIVEKLSTDQSDGLGLGRRIAWNDKDCTFVIYGFDKKELIEVYKKL